MPGRAPPGRAGRTWLAARLEVAARAVELLEQKQQLLRREHHRLTEVVAGTGDAWRAAAGEADQAGVRALVSGGRDELRRAAAMVGAADVRVAWTTQAGISYPGLVQAAVAPAPALDSPALSVAAAACRRALDAGARHAAASTALRRVEDELLQTVRRLRAIRNRWIPHLEAEIAQLDQRLDDAEREEVTRLRWAGHAAPPATL